MTNPCPPTELPIIPANERSWVSVLFQLQRPLLPQELNLIQDVIEERDRIWSIFFGGSGFVKNFNPQSGTNNVYTVHRDLENSTQLAIVGGNPLIVGGSNTSDPSSCLVTLPAPPSTAGRTDLVFLEVWKAEIVPGQITNKPSTSSIYRFGNTQYTGAQLEDDLIWDSVGIETTRRVQLQYRFRAVAGVDFTLSLTGGRTNSKGMEDPAVLAQGVNSTPVSGYTFLRNSLDHSLFVAGSGSDTDKENLGTYDGFVYALPVHKITRGTTTSISLGSIAAIFDLVNSSSGFGSGDAIVGLKTDTDPVVRVPGDPGDSYVLIAGEDGISVEGESIDNGDSENRIVIRGTGTSVIVRDEGGSGAVSHVLNFEGDGVTVADPVAEGSLQVRTITIPGVTAAVDEVIAGPGLTSVDGNSTGDVTLAVNFEPGGGSSNQVVRASSPRLLTTAQAAILVGGPSSNADSLHSHSGTGGGISRVTPGNGLTGTQLTGPEVNLSARLGTGLLFSVSGAISCNFGTTAGTVTEGNDPRLLTVAERNALTFADGVISDADSYHTHGGLLSPTQKTGLTSGGFTTLHKHDGTFPALKSVSVTPVVTTSGSGESLMASPHLNGVTGIPDSPLVMLIGTGIGGVAAGTEAIIEGQGGGTQMLVQLRSNSGELPKGSNGAVVQVHLDLSWWIGGNGNRNGHYRVRFRYVNSTSTPSLLDPSNIFSEHYAAIPDINSNGFHHDSFISAPLTVASGVSNVTVVATVTGFNTVGGREGSIVTRYMTAKVYPA